MLDQSRANEMLVFADNDTPASANDKEHRPWKIMIVDDDPGIHDVTMLALDGFTFGNRDLEFVQCFSGEEAMQAIRLHPDTACILLDVVMETDSAGLDVARKIREEEGNTMVRIVLRTGQPGQAPERDVIRDYDINDYKEKTELTSIKLFTLMHSVLRSYRDIQTIEASKRGLTHIIEASANIFKLSSIDQFAGGVLEQLTALLHIEPGALYMNSGGLAAQYEDDCLRVIAGTGGYSVENGTNADLVLNEEQLNTLSDVRDLKANVYADHAFIGFFDDRIGNENLLYVDGIEKIDPLDRNLVELFTRNVSIAFENIHLHEDLEATQREIVYMLGEAVETRSKETGNHVKRVAELSKLLALEYGLDLEEAEIIKLASPLHDVGKIGIPDAILNKPGRHTDEERQIMKTHAEIGRNMLAGSKRRILQAGAIIANEHHERWDGAGYPNGKKNRDIHIYGRITAVADVFDALGSARCYKEAWPMDKVIDLMKEEQGQQFDPRLVDILLGNMEKVTAICNRYTDAGAHIE